MAFGFPPKHAEDFALNDMTSDQFVVVANETAKGMQWNVAHISDVGLIAYTDKGMFSWNAEIKIKIEGGIAHLSSASTGSEVMDLGRNKDNINKFVAAFRELKATLTTEDIQARYQELRATFPANPEDPLKLPPPTTTERVTGFFSIFKPAQGYFVTPILMDLNILVFVLMILSGVNIMLPDNESLLNWGANFRPMTLSGQWWRLLTSCFLHIGIFHLLMNLYALLYIGVLLEPRLGRTRFISAYLLTGIAASVTSLWWHDLTISAGASGAIFGMYGVFLAMLTTDFIEKNARKALLTSIGIFVGYNLLFGLQGGVDNAAHIGGLVSGLVIGYAFIPSLKRPEEVNLKYGTVGLLAMVIIISSFLVYQRMPNDIGEYDEKIKQFAILEQIALGVYNMPENTPNEKMLAEIEERGIYNWNEIIKLIDSFQGLDLPLEIRTQNRLLREYCVLRIESYEIMYKAFSEDTDKYQEQIVEYNEKIEAKLEELRN